MYPRRPLNIYSSSSRKRARSSSSQPRSRAFSPQDETHEDITVTEMSRRMLKRSLSGVKNSKLGRKEDVGEHSSKKRKHTSRSRVPLAEVPQQRGLLEHLSYIPKTPPPQINATQDSVMAKTPGVLSPPISTGRRTIIRTDPRKRENQARVSSSTLSSPFARQQPALGIQSTQILSLKPRSQFERTRSTASALRRNSAKLTQQSTRSSQSALKRHTTAAQHAKKTVQQEWLIPPPQADPILHGSPRNVRALDFSISREGSFFANSPQAFSTPTHSHKPSPSSNQVTSAPLLHCSQDSGKTGSRANLDEVVNDVTMNESTPRARMMLEDYITYPADLAHCDSMEPAESSSRKPASSAQKVRRHTHFHYSEDSIFSSALDFSESMTIKQPLPLASAIRDSVDPSRLDELLSKASTPVPLDVLPHVKAATPADPSPSVSDREEMRELFSVFDINGAGKEWDSPIADDLEFNPPATSAVPNEPASTQRGTSPSAKLETLRGTRNKAKNSVVGPKRLTSSSSVRAPRKATRPHSTRAISLDSSSPPKSVKGKKLPTVRMRIDDEPLKPSSDGDDELLLTSRGWDWEPGSDS